MAIGVLAVIIFLFDILREERSVPLTKYSGVKNSCSTGVESALCGYRHTTRAQKVVSMC